jgi:molybdopterin/thiamine biosynthesis adenylyltransferase
MDSRYSRQHLFKPIGEAGQHKLLQSRIAIVGMGALGTVLANHMVRAGVGYIRIIDRDFVEWSNLQRQMLYDEDDAKQSSPKAEAAKFKLQRINSDIEIDAHVVDLNPINAEQLLSDVDLVLDGTDNFAIRFLINDVCTKHNIPWVYGGAVSSRGVSMLIIPGQTPCLRCVFGQAPAQGSAETCDTAGVIGPIIHIIASYQSTEALKWLVGDKESLHGKMLQTDLWQHHYSAIDMSKARKPDCICCAKHEYEFLEQTLTEDTIQSLCGRNAVQITPTRPASLKLSDWAERLKQVGQVELNPFLLKFHTDEAWKIVLFTDGRAIVQGTDDLTKARTLYSRYIGM